MDNQRVDELNSFLEEIGQKADAKTAAKLELDKCKRIIQRLSSFSSDCEKCDQLFLGLENHLIRLKSKAEHLTEGEIKHHKKLIGTISSHLQKQHKVVTQGYYLALYMSIGISIGTAIGLVVFDNLVLGLPLGMCIGIAIGTGLDEDAKKKGLTL
ncbi:hypothetical protein EVU96_20240 [Bacillus infantis]|uniref:hypothetical protein n=1 Tax=Bacillus infantis TaxID=324767 RepID=UPI00101C1C4A|nr:hypothetical protein [Bacillus infantis]RYI26695.1 hypothetical protein EVU96_20240 [Bacillus infantis]